jgi:hypothetical protein
MNPDFQTFLEGIPSISLPISIKGCSINTLNLPTIKREKYASKGANYAYGKLLLNNDYIVIIFLGSADCEIPIVAT